MTVDVALTPAHRRDTEWLYAVSTAYFRELLPDRPGPPVNEITHWFDDSECSVLVITANTQHAGFALVDRMKDHHELAEFCVLPDWRNAGIGTKAATFCFERFPGPWSLGVASARPGTARFWDRLLPTLPDIEGLARGPALTPYQSHSYTFTFRDTS